ncbi:MAG TPA: peptidylprolyl isomerase [Prolixibacteraceae bacterium]|nr:peptidylprolyl isomerase [Prolixibacteraceae bacterium]
MKYSSWILCTILFTSVSIHLLAGNKDEIIVTIGKEKISRQEFEANYLKNNTNILNKKDIKSPKDYLDLFIKFRLKVLEAEALGYDTVKSFRDELGSYRKELARPYLTDVSYNEEILKEEYYRTQYERKASHILIRVAPDAAPADTLAAWNKISDIRKRVVNGENFNDLAAKYSEDPSAIQNKGQLGYFSAFQMVYPFEDMAYKTPVGQVSGILRTRFGYHILKVEDERPAAGEIKVTHIMKMFPPQASDDIVNKLKQMADSLLLVAKSGADFAELARKYSDDKQSAPDGGVMNWFTMNNMVPSFAEAAFALQKDGDISPVIKTPYGWHIIKRLERRQVEPFDKLRPTLETKVRQNPLISKHSDEAFDRKLQAEYHLKINEEAQNKMMTAATDSSAWTSFGKNIQERKAILFSFADKQINCSDFIDYLAKQKFVPNREKAQEQISDQLNKFIHNCLFDYEDALLEKKYTDFASLYTEYHDGILLFNISKDKIWDAASKDTLGLQKYFANAAKKYYWNERFHGWILHAKDLQTKANLEQFLAGKEVKKEEIEDVFNSGNESKVEITEVKVEKGANPIVDYFIWNGSKPSGFDETTTFVNGKIEKNEVKELKDAWGLYSSDYQELIEKQWIDALKIKFPIRINQKVLKKVQSLQ